MATTTTWATPEAIASALTTELNSLADGAYTAVSAAIDNLTGLYEYIEIEVALASITSGAGAPFIAVYLVKQIDGTNYEDGGGSVAPAATSLIATFPLRASLAGAQRIIRANIPIPPAAFKLVALNSAGAALASSGSTVKYRRFNESNA